MEFTMFAIGLSVGYSKVTHDHVSEYAFILEKLARDVWRDEVANLAYGWKCEPEIYCDLGECLAVAIDAINEHYDREPIDVIRNCLEPILSASDPDERDPYIEKIANIFLAGLDRPGLCPLSL